MNTVSIYLKRTIVYEGRNKCLVCSGTRKLIRKDYDINARDFTQVPLGPGIDNYGRDRFLSPPPPIPEPDPIRTVVHCANKSCLAKYDIEKNRELGVEVVEDSAVKDYEEAKQARDNIGDAHEV